MRKQFILTSDIDFLNFHAKAPEITKALENYKINSAKLFYETLTQDLPSETHINIDVFQQTEASDIQLDSFSMEYDGALGRFSFSRYIDHKDNTISNTGAFCHGDGVKKANIHKIIQRNLLALYEQLNITAVKIECDQIGSYAWARLGYKPDVQSWVRIRKYIAQRLDFISNVPDKTGGVLDPAQADLIHKILQHDDPKALWAIVDQNNTYSGYKIGKVLVLSWFYFENLQPLLGGLDDDDVDDFLDSLEWSGALDLKDIDSMSRFKAYIEPTQKGPQQKLQPKGRQSRLKI